MDIGALIDGVQVTVSGKIELIATKRSPRKRMLITEAVLADGTGQVRVVWFGQPFIGKTLNVGDEIFLSGKTKSDMFGLQLVNPSYEKAKQETVHTGRIVPIYPLTAGMTQKQLRFLVSQVLPLAAEVPEWLPEDVRDRADVMSLPDALRLIHFPDTNDDVAHAERRLKFDELFVLQLRAEMIRQTLKRAIAPSLPFHEAEVKSFVTTTPFF
jgi:ATP-dependent DNA helicase RecG